LVRGANVVLADPIGEVVPPLAVNQSRSACAAFVSSHQVGILVGTVVVDPNHSVPELREDNNSLLFTVQVVAE
jgi:hypothetical protein